MDRQSQVVRELQAEVEITIAQKLNHLIAIQTFLDESAKMERKAPIPDE